VAVNTVLVLPQHSPKLFRRFLVSYFLEVDKTYVDIFCILLRFPKICWRAKIWFVELRPGKKLYWASSSFGSVQLFRSIFLKGTWHLLFQEGWERNASAVIALLSVSLFAYEGDQPNSPIIRCFSRTLCHLTHTSQLKNSFSMRSFKTLQGPKSHTIVAMTLSSHILPTDRARELLQPSKDAENLLVSIQNLAILDLSFHVWPGRDLRSAGP